MGRPYNRARAVETELGKPGDTETKREELAAAFHVPVEEVRVTSETGGQKGSKLARFDLIPPHQLQRLAEHYGKGAEKYDDNNWRKGYDWKLSYSALQRHLTAFWMGEDIDPETGSLHLIAAAWHCFALAEFWDIHGDYDHRLKTIEQRAQRELDQEVLDRTWTDSDDRS